MYVWLIFQIPRSTILPCKQYCAGYVGFLRLICLGPLGTCLYAAHYYPGQYVKIQGVTWVIKLQVFIIFCLIVDITCTACFVIIIIIRFLIVFIVIVSIIVIIIIFVVITSKNLVSLLPFQRLHLSPIKVSLYLCIFSLNLVKYLCPSPHILLFFCMSFLEAQFLNNVSLLVLSGLPCHPTILVFYLIMYIFVLANPFLFFFFYYYYFRKTKL